MRTLTTSDANRQVSGIIYSKITELLFISLLLVFIYPFGFAISGIDPTLPLEDQSPTKIVYYLQWVFPVLCLAIAFMYRGSSIFLSIPTTIMIYSMICLTSTIWSVDPYDTFKYASLTFLYIVAIMAICHVLDIEVICKLIVKVLVFLILASVVMAVAFPKYGTHQPGDSFEGIHAGHWRGVFVHKNLLGAAASVSLFVFLFFRRLMDVSFGFRLMCIVAAVACLIFAGSAGSWVVLWMLLVYYCIIKYAPVSGNLLLLIIIGVSALGFTSFYFFTEDLVAVVGRDTTFTGRTEIWQVVLDAIWQKPILGFGYYAAIADFIKPLLVGVIGPAAVDAHNGYLDVLLGTGIVGLISLLFCILSVLVRGFGRVKRSAGPKADCLMLLLIFPFSSLLFMFFEGAMTEVQGTLDTLTFLSLTAVPFYLQRKLPSRLRNLGTAVEAAAPSAVKTCEA